MHSFRHKRTKISLCCINASQRFLDFITSATLMPPTSSFNFLLSSSSYLQTLFYFGIPYTDLLSVKSNGTKPAATDTSKLQNCGAYLIGMCKHCSRTQRLTSQTFLLEL